jgi:putative oxidoreductase
MKESQNTMRDTLLLIGRILLVVIFVTSGANKLFGLEGTAGYIASKGLPMATALALLAALAELGLGLAIAAGFKTRLAALGLAAFTLLTIPFFHDFWNMADQARAMNQLQAMKNLSIVGAFLAVAAAGAGRYSVDRA